jgi:hypothetical protein
MRAGTVLVALVVVVAAFAACTATPSGPAASVRERLEAAETPLAIEMSESAGSITAQRRSAGQWIAGFVELTVEHGDLAVTADDTGRITLQRLAVDLGPIEIPESVLGYAAQLTNVHVESKRPVGVKTTWTGDDDATATAPVDLELTWSLTIDGHTSPLGAPDLPEVPIELLLSGNGEVVHAEARVLSPGIVWSWAELVKLEDLSLILAAATVEP